MSHGAEFTAFFDSSALYPLRLRDLLLRLASTDLFRARWSADVLADWVDGYVAMHPQTLLKDLEQECALMNSAARDALVDDDQSLIPVFSSLDATAAHVFAAAFYSRSDVIVTSDGRRYPDDLLKQYRLHKEHPDEFIAHLIDLDAAKAFGAVKEARNALHNPRRDAPEYLLMLERAGPSLSPLTRSSVAVELAAVAPHVHALMHVFPVIFDDAEDPFWRVLYPNLYPVANTMGRDEIRFDANYDPWLGRELAKRLCQPPYACGLLVYVGLQLVMSRVVFPPESRVPRLAAMSDALNVLSEDQTIDALVWSWGIQVHGTTFTASVDAQNGRILLPRGRDPCCWACDHPTPCCGGGSHCHSSSNTARRCPASKTS